MTKHFYLAWFLLSWLAGLGEANGQGFSSSATTWTIPTGGYMNGTTDYGFYLSDGYFPNSGATIAAGTQNWTTTDLNGDTKPDLVVASQYQSNGPFPFGTTSNPYWKVYMGTSTGFSTAPTTWAVPASGGYSDGTTNYGFFSTFYNGLATNASNSQNWQLLDLNGDAKPDLVVTGYYLTSNGLTAFGTTPNRYWKVYLNTGNGFSPTAINWVLPSGGLVSDGVDYSYSTLNIEASFSSASVSYRQAWTTFDLNGDAKPDLIVASSFETGYPVGTAPGRFWKVYLNTGSGFSTSATNWGVPTGGYLNGTTDYGFYATGHTSYFDFTSGSQLWALRDMTGDAKPDLVVTSQSQGNKPMVFGTAPNRYWKVYTNTGMGFSTTAINWSLPTGGYLSGGVDYGFSSIVVGQLGDTGSQYWQLADLNRDNKLDLVVTSQLQGTTPLAFGSTPNRYWKTYLNTGSGFATAATTWALPTGGYSAGGVDFGFFTSYFSSTSATRGAAGSQNWGTFDLNGDGLPDLLINSELQNGAPLPFGTVPNRYWKVYFSSAVPLAATASVGLATGMTLYPNPTSGQLTLTSPTSLAGRPYAILDALGRSVRTGQLGAAASTLDVQNLPPGVYGVRVDTAPRLWRFVKQ